MTAEDGEEIHIRFTHSETVLYRAGRIVDGRMIPAGEQIPPLRPGESIFGFPVVYASARTMRRHMRRAARKSKGWRRHVRRANAKDVPAR